MEIFGQTRFVNSIQLNDTDFDVALGRSLIATI
jgi:hypothetical protein